MPGPRAGRPTEEERQLAEDAARIYGQEWSVRRVAAEFECDYGKLRRILAKQIVLKNRGGQVRANSTTAGTKVSPSGCGLLRQQPLGGVGGGALASGVPRVAPRAGTERVTGIEPALPTWEVGTTDR
jgi:hypothetical protein